MTLLDFGIDNRKLALVFWIIVLIVFMIRDSKFRASIKQLVRTFLYPKVFLSFLFSGLYTILIIYVLWMEGFWHIRMLADTIIWVLGTSFGLLLYSAKLREPGKFKTLIREYFSATLLLDFFVNLYPMKLIFELMFLPFMTCLFGMLAVSENDSKYTEVKKLTNGLIATMGFCILIYSASAIVGDASSIKIIPFAENLLLIPLLTALYIPFLYCIVLIMAYESFFTHLGIYNAPRAIEKPTLWKVFKHSRFSLNKLNTYSANLFQEYIRSATED